MLQRQLKTVFLIPLFPALALADMPSPVYVPEDDGRGGLGADYTRSNETGADYTRHPHTGADYTGYEKMGADYTGLPAQSTSTYRTEPSARSTSTYRTEPPSVAPPPPAPAASGNALAQTEDQLLARDIRESLATDDTLFPNGNDIEIVVRNGKATLYGTVSSQLEKDAMAARAERIAGPLNVLNQLVVDNTPQEEEALTP